MPDILHRVGITAPPEAVFRALTVPEELAAWWTSDTRSIDGSLLFRFGDVGGFDMKVLEAVACKTVRWEVTDGPPEWVGTTVSFELSQDGDWTILLFAHAGWRAPVEFMHHCSTKWAVFLMSLKSLVETGRGAPHPHDLRISNWH